MTRILIDQFINEIKKTDGKDFTSISYELGQDSAGGEAVWIKVRLKNNAGRSRQQIDKLCSFVETCERKLSKKGVSAWPYVNFIDA